MNLEVVPIKGRAAAERCLLVLFETDPVSARAERARRSPPRPLAPRHAADGEVARLERRSWRRPPSTCTRVVREHEAALEELQATNEEALSSNEELQS